LDLSGKNTMVVGLGESGLAVVRFMAGRGARVVVNDQRDRDALGAAATEAEELGAQLVLGGHPDSAFEDLELIVVSPGVPPLAQLDRAEQHGVPVISEIELAARGEMSRRLERPVFVGGNLGRPMIEAAGTDAGAKGGLVIVELSSFQLERVSQMKAHVAILLNITPDHLDRYPSFEAYAAAKARIFERQDADDFAVLPADAADLRELIEDDGTVVLFGGRAGDVRVVDGVLADLQSGLRVPVDELRIRGSHNVSNACAACACGALAGCSRRRHRFGAP